MPLDTNMTTQDVLDIIQKIQFPAYQFFAIETEGGWLLWAMLWRQDAVTGEFGWGESRREYVPLPGSLDGLVKTCWLLVELTQRHEAMEFFTFEGKRVFDPHMPIAKLIALQAQREEEGNVNSTHR